MLTFRLILLILVIYLFLILLITTLSLAIERKTLKVTHVVFRHGDRTPEERELYPKDPYRNYQFPPYGLAQLTNVGKQRAAAVGKALRKRYKNFLEPIYNRSSVEAITTNYSRTEQSLQLVLEGLFPPTNVDFEYGFDVGPLLNGLHCYNYYEYYFQVLESEVMKNKLATYREVMEVMTEETGTEIGLFIDVYPLYLGLVAKMGFGLELPEWTKNIYPSVLEAMVLEEYLIQSATIVQQQILAGYLLQKIITDTETPSGIRTHLYSAHEYNLVALLTALGAFEPPAVPNYGAYLLFEVYQFGGAKLGLKVLYQNYGKRGAKVVRIKGCEEICDWDAFKEIVGGFLPVGDLC